MKPFLGSAVLVGLMRGMTQNGLNLVNAPILAKEAGISLFLNTHPDTTSPVPSAGPDAVQVKVTRGLQTHVLLGESMVIYDLGNLFCAMRTEVFVLSSNVFLPLTPRPRYMIMYLKGGKKKNP